MLFTLEALQARGGDCLILLYGRPTKPKVIVIDGGPTKSVYRRLRDRLDAIREGIDDREPLEIELVMVSHIDDDHIDGLLHLMRQIRDEADGPPSERSYVVRSLWHNSFDDVLGNGADELRAASLDTLQSATPTSDTTLVLASVNQGRRLRALAEELALDPPLIVAGRDDRPKNFGRGLKLHVVGPLEEQLEDLHELWEKHLEKLAAEGTLDPVETASFADRSAANLASLVVLAEADGKTMLLTGDARGDHLAESLEARGLLERPWREKGRLHVDLFKLPHHGSNRNVERSTFRAITADHYVISGDGHHSNPDPDTFEMLFGGRDDAGLLDRPFEIHLTYPPEQFPERTTTYPLDALWRILDSARAAGHRFELVAPTDEELVRVDLGEPLDRVFRAPP